MIDSARNETNLLGRLENGFSSFIKLAVASLIGSSLILATEFAQADRGREDRDERKTDRQEERDTRVSRFDAQRRLRKGAGGRTGNENSVRPGRLPRLGAPIEKDRQRDNDENKVEKGKTGCPEGSFALTFAPDGMSFSILFDKFVAQTSKTQPMDIMRCNLIVPIDVPANTRMTITRIDYRGFVNIPAGGFAVLRAAFAFQGVRNGGGPGNGRAYAVNFRQDFQGPTAISDQNYTLSSDAFTDRQAVSACGGVNNLRISNGIRLQSGGQDAMMTLDSADGAGELKYYVSYESCTN